MRGRLSTVADAEIDGRPAIGVTSTTRSASGVTRETLYAQAKGQHLPEREVVTQGRSRVTVTLSRWNEPVTVAAPRQAVPIAVVEQTH